MKDCIYDFAKEYVARVNDGEIQGITLESILEGTDSNFSELRTKWDAIKCASARDNLIKLDKRTIIYDYLVILVKYFEQKQLMQYTSTAIAYRTCQTPKGKHVPLMTVRRYEELKNIVGVDVLMAILKVVGVKLTYTTL